LKGLSEAPPEQKTRKNQESLTPVAFGKTRSGLPTNKDNFARAFSERRKKEPDKDPSFLIPPQTGERVIVSGRSF